MNKNNVVFCFYSSVRMLLSEIKLADPCYHNEEMRGITLCLWRYEFPFSLTRLDPKKFSVTRKSGFVVKFLYILLPSICLW